MILTSLDMIQIRPITVSQDKVLEIVKIKDQL
jgi:hypothetical protein